MIIMIDLHTHSNASDGSCFPAELIELGIKHGLTVMALTDHDTIGGLEEAKKAAGALGMGFIPGIELEISMQEAISGEFHLLGLGIVNPVPGFFDAVAFLAHGREERNRQILKRMADDFGINAAYEDLLALAGGNTIGRPHFASYLVKHKIVKNNKQAFSKYLAKGRPLYIPKPGLDFKLAVSVIHESGGLAILAHPMSLYIGWGRLPDYIKALKESGLDGLEAWHPTAKAGECKRLEEIANNLDIFVTAGSDFHGEARPDRKLGITAGNKKIERTLLDKIPLLAGRL
ncbi:MAG: PHP domain-containing protein [Treponema sp.]|nr:PHP domain-containing protein [Treponema sp.]